MTGYYYCREKSSKIEMMTTKSSDSSPQQKPALISKRTVSLPADLQNTTVETRNLFWFVPRDHHHNHQQQRQQQQQQQQQQRNYHHQYTTNHRNNESEYCKASPLPEKQTGTGMIIHNGRLPSCQEFPEKVALQWILSDSTAPEHSEDEYCDDHDCPLLGLEFVEWISNRNRNRWGKREPYTWYENRYLRVRNFILKIIYACRVKISIMFLLIYLAVGLLIILLSEFDACRCQIWLYVN